MRFEILTVASYVDVGLLDRNALWTYIYTHTNISEEHSASMSVTKDEGSLYLQVHRALHG